MFRINHIVVNPFEESTYLLTDTATLDTLVVDPGMMQKEEFDAFKRVVDSNSLKICQIVNTHLHIDHCFGNSWVRNRYGVKVAASPGDEALGKSVAAQAHRFGLRFGTPEPVEIDVPLADGDTIKVGESSLKVIAVPGHSHGGIALYCPEQKFVISGDSLFHRSIGRTDFEGGNHAQLVDNITKKLLTLPDDTTVLPGHGPFTTIGEEKRFNPML